MQLVCPECGAPLDAGVAGEVSVRCDHCQLDVRLSQVDETLDSPLGRARREPDEALPERLGRYRILGKLGSGGFATVLKGLDEELRREVAIKIPHRQRISSPQDIAQYLSEAQVVAALDHPGVVPVYDVGRTDDGRCYVVSKFVPGSTLEERMRSARPAHRQSAEMIARMADAAHHAHRRGLVHRDIKPANILCDREGDYYLADFGLALRDEDPVDDSLVVGSPAYMSPEQASGEGHRIDARTDVYSLGVVLYELLTGRRPFQAPDVPSLLESVLRQEPRPPRQLDDSIPRELDRICLKSLSKRIADRYSTALDLAEDLRLWLRQAPSSGEGSTQSPSVTASRSEMMYEERSLQQSGSLAAPASSTRSAFQPDASSRVAAAVPGSSGSELGPVRIIPKGLRSFESEDADFFLELLPGPRDRDGLPESVRFWKRRLEERDPGRTFSVGLLYGPSGCGKSSLIKAGVLPRLLPNVTHVYVEATADGTEQALLNGLRRAISGLSTELSLVETATALRRGEGLPPHRKVVLVIDQFEQWLHASRGEADTNLVQALRQCDGSHLQCVVLVRDDFWMSMTRFMRDLEVRIVEGENSAAVDLFSPRHARKVLTGFGRAYGCLPGRDAELSDEQREFLRGAVDELAEGGRVVPVRLALFADMLKTRPWMPATLKNLGGAQGIGVTFFEETFSSSSAPPEHRLHLRAARRVLRALLYLPGEAADIKGHQQPRSELLKASGYAAQPREFDDLMRILDRELRIITPTDPEEDTSLRGEPRRGERCYQLTHDYLVPPLREWLTRKQRETMRGRAQLRLADRTALWHPRPRSSYLPTPFEFVNIGLLTRRQSWTAAQRKMMRAAGRWYAARLALVAVAMALLGAGVLEVRGHLRARALCEQLLLVETFRVSPLVHEIDAHRRWTRPLLETAYTEADDGSRQRLNASLALLKSDDGQVAYLYRESLQVDPHVFMLLRDALFNHRDKLMGPLWALLESSAADREKRFRAALMLASYDRPGPRDSQSWQRWKGVAPFLVTRLLETAVQDTAHFEGFQDGLLPAGAVLLDDLQAYYRDPQKSESERAIAMNIVERYVPDDPRAIADLLLVADEPERFEKHIGSLSDEQRRGPAVEYLARALQRDASADLQPQWGDASLDPAWNDPPPDVVAAVQAGLGMVRERFAFCQTMSLDEFEAAAEGLRTAGYRPVQVRPYRAEEGTRVAALWTRDALDWRFARGLTGTEAVTRNDQWMADKFFPVDMAAYRTGDDLHFALLSAADPAIVDSRLVVAVLQPEFLQEFDRWKRDFQIASQQMVYGADDEQRFSMVWVQRAEDTEGYTATQFSFGYQHATFDAAQKAGRLPLADVCVFAAPPPEAPEDLNRKRVARYTEALASNPDDTTALFNRGIAHYVLKDYQAALQDLDQYIEKVPTRWTTYYYRAATYAALGRESEARADVARYRALNPQVAYHVMLQAVVDAHFGSPDSALRQLVDLARRKTDEPLVAYAAAAAHAVCARLLSDEPARAAQLADRAFELLEEALQNGFLLYSFLEDDDWSGLQDDPRLIEIKRRGRLDRRYTSLTRTDPLMESSYLDDLPAAEHLERCRDMVAQGYRPVSLSAVTIPQSGLTTSASVWKRPMITEAVKDDLQSQRVNAAVALWRLEQPDYALEMLQASADPRARSFLIHELARLGVEPSMLGARLSGEDDSSILRAVIQALGQYDEERLPPAARQDLVPRLVELFHHGADAGVHSSCEWLLRRWGFSDRLSEPQRAAAEFDPGEPRWYTSGEGHTFTVVPGPIEFEMGSPASEAGKSWDESRHTRRIHRTYAIATKPVTVAQFRRFLADHPEVKHTPNDRYSPEPECPIISVSYHDAIRYCRWLSEREDIPEFEMCYPPVDRIRSGHFPRHEFLTRSGYRLPTEAEWEFAARGGASTRFHFGDSQRLMDQYSWFSDSSENRSHLVGSLKPNSLGLFDVHGNVWEWCQNVYVQDLAREARPVYEDKSEMNAVTDTTNFVLRSAGFNSSALTARVANRGYNQARSTYLSNGFRVARTIPSFEIVPARQLGWGRIKFRLSGVGAPFRIGNVRGEVQVSPLEGTLPAEVTVAADPAEPMEFSFEVEQLETGEVKTATGIVVPGSPWDVRFYTFDRSKPLTDQYRQEIFRSPPIASESSNDIDYYWDVFEEPAAGVAHDYYATLADARAEIPAGHYDLIIRANNGIRLLVDAQPVFQRWPANQEVDEVIRIELQAGEHDFRIEHYEASGFAMLQCQLVPVED